ncbi:MAG TPA: ribosome biogenesis GTP-binding protein YihA/YsxC [Steroidobacteraceae bacterium]|nr:ribosome biogenesis GTP-binding protein YihA/YsxC [Steroidobacteraceae bacterium]
MYTTVFRIRDAAVAGFAHARFLLSVASLAQFPPDHGAEVAFAGRSNAGKSSALNAILARRALARTGKTPGRTRLLNYFELGAAARIVDLPGYGYAQVSERERLAWQPLLARLRERRSLRGLFLIIDARREVTALDLALIDWAAHAPVHVLLTKADKLNRSDAARALRNARAALSQPTVQLFSAVSGEGVSEAQQVLREWLGDKKTPETSGEVTGAD